MVKVLARHRKASFHYEILETYEAGIVLTGAEIKSVRAGKVSLAEGWVSMEDGEAMLRQVYIAPYQASSADAGGVRPRKLLLHRRELNKLAGAVAEKGLAIIPLSVYIKHRWAKVKVGLARGKKLYDKRAAVKKRTTEREMAAHLKHQR